MTESREIRVSIPENVGTRELLAILGRRGTNMAQVPERGVRDVRDSWGVEALFGGFDKPEQVHSRLVIPPKVRPIRVVTLESPLLNLKFPPLHRRRLRSPTTATAAGPTAVSTHWNYRGTSNDSSRSSRATGRWSPIAPGRTSCPRGPPPGSELGAFRASSTSRHRPSRSWRGGCVQRHPRSLHGRPPRRRGTSASERA